MDKIYTAFAAIGVKTAEAKLYDASGTPIPPHYCHGKLLDYDVLHPGSDAGKNDGCVIIAAYKVGSATQSDIGGNFDMMRLPCVDLNALAAKMEKDLQPLGMWDETSFGLWAVLTVI